MEWCKKKLEPNSVEQGSKGVQVKQCEWTKEGGEAKIGSLTAVHFALPINHQQDVCTFKLTLTSSDAFAVECKNQYLQCCRPAMPSYLVWWLSVSFCGVKKSCIILETKKRSWKTKRKKKKKGTEKKNFRLVSLILILFCSSNENWFHMCKAKDVIPWLSKRDWLKRWSKCQRKQPLLKTEWINVCLMCVCVCVRSWNQESLIQPLQQRKRQWQI